ncbi:GDSL esterase/lipase At5g14450-like isoform X1 [Trifolium pratense]|uniref:GDSL esterase/lipase At5g14450-like isoform X1 n=1 Tax=Trifolium pratense TaxID=57577 RepID=UPI001E6940F1|nr:GDSL esterase/lipase At5g14450-like isoform X1 [Trifolium pratense]
MKKSLTYFTAIVLLLSWFLFGSKKLSWFLKIQAEKSSEPCEFQTIFNFGDSNSDTGSMSAAFYPASLPYGETFFHEGAGRSSDGRLIIDFIAEHLGLPMLSAYINSIGTTYRHGVNFAAGSSTIMRQNKSYFDGGSPFTLEIQIGQFIQFKSRTGKFFMKENESSFGKHFPKPEDFSKAIYTFDIGQNDMTDVISKMGKEDSHVLISNIVELFSKQVQSLYFFGAKTFWIHNTGPIGCLPLARPIHNAENNQTKVAGYLDQNGCVNLTNDLAKEFNKKLKDEVVKLRAQFHNASLIYVDMFSAKYELFSNANKSGFVDPSKICCGYHEDGYHVFCGSKQTINGTEIVTSSCEDPSKYISWDGVHYTEAANQWIADRIVDGSFSDPPLPISQSCQITH